MSLEIFYKKLNQNGPSILLLGQEYQNNLLSKFFAHHEHDVAAGKNSYEQFWDLESNVDKYKILQSLSFKLSKNPDLEIISKFKWNSIFTSLIYSDWQEVFRTDQRSILPIHDIKYWPSNYLNPTQLSITYLFGSVDSEENLPPLDDNFSYREIRTNKSSQFLQRIKSLIGINGMVILDGYTNKDMLSTNLLYDHLNELPSKSIFLFGANEELLSDAYINKLIEKGILIEIADSLSNTLSEAESKGKISFDTWHQGLVSKKSVTFYNNKKKEEDRLQIPNDIWNRVAGSVKIFGDDLLNPPNKISEEEKFNRFFDFIGTASQRLKWNGFKYNFPVPRDCHDELINKVNRRLKENQQETNPFFIGGQASAGKTMSMGILSYRIKIENNFPVLYIYKLQSIKDDWWSIDSICKMMHKKGVQKILIVWDGMKRRRDYRSLNNFLNGRGHKILLVGSVYEGQKSSDMEIPIESTPDECEQIIEHLKTLDPNNQALYDTVFRKIINKNNSHFHFYIYHLIRSAQIDIKKGQWKESVHYREAMTKIWDNLQNIESDSENNSLSLNPFQQAIVDAGLVKDSEDYLNDIEGDRKNAVQTIFYSIWIIGEFDLNIPFDLLLRILNKYEVNITDLISDITERIHNISWFEEKGHHFIGPRNYWEASLILNVENLQTSDKVNYITQIIESVIKKDIDRDPEIYFLTQLSKAILNNKTYNNHYYDFANTLRKIRTEYSVEHPSIMIQESIMYRNYYQAKENAIRADLDRGRDLTDEEKDWYINNVEMHHKRMTEPLLEAQDFMEEIGIQNKLRLHIINQLINANAHKSTHYKWLVHYSSLIGINDIEKDEFSDKSKKGFLECGDEALKQIDNPNINSTYDIVTAYTIFRNLLEGITAGLIDDDNNLEDKIHAKILYLFSNSDENLQANEYNKILECQFEYSHQFSNYDLQEETFEKLKEEGSSAGFYMRAFNIVRDLEFDFEKVLFSDEEKEKYKECYQYLEENIKFINLDSKCLHLRFKAWYNWKVGGKILREEGIVLPFSFNEIKQCYDMLNEMENFLGENFSINFSMIYSIVRFYLNPLDGMQSFKEVERSDIIRNMGSKRIIKSFIYGDENGNKIPIKDGVVKWYIDSNKKGSIGCKVPHKSENVTSHLQISVPFLGWDFDTPNWTKGAPIGEFYIGFNFRGPVAVPIQNI